jgi:DNA-binding response OmpR family regulator
VDVYIGYLRLKLQAFEKIVGPVIMTIRGKGFMLQL